MEEIVRRIQQHGIFNYIYLANLLLAFHYFFVVYVNSPFLSTLMDEQLIGFLYMMGSGVALALLLISSRLLNLFGNFKLTLAFITLEALALLGLAFAQSTGLILLYFIVHMAVNPVLLFNLDVFLESYSNNEDATGRVRGFFLTAMNIAVVLSPFLVGFILVQDEFWKVYLSSAMFLAVLLWLIVAVFRRFKDPGYRETRAIDSVVRLWRNSDERNVFFANFLLQFLYAWAAVYIPLYLSNHIGFSWSTLGPLFAFMLTPFLLFEYPIGRIADTWLGEKEIMTTGFVIAASSVALIPLVTVANPVVWGALLFISRTGAALVEITTESYFFKQVDDNDTDIIGLFRMTRPLAFSIGPVVASLTLFFLPLQHIFFVLSAILITGVFFSSAIWDTK
jgi:MFS family permease